MSRRHFTKVQVTAEDIATGERQMCWDCPIAKALKRATGLDWHVMCNTASPDVHGDGGLGAAVELPIEAVLFIRKVDNSNLPPEPFSFLLPYRSPRKETAVHV